MIDGSLGDSRSDVIDNFAEQRCQIVAVDDFVNLFGSLQVLQAEIII